MTRRAERTIAVNERGKPIGEDHYNAKLTDGEVERIRYLHEVEGMSYRQIAEIFEVSRGSIVKICLYQRRNQFAAKFKKVTIGAAP